MISFRKRIYVPEAMEAADADAVKHERSYAQLAVINRTIARMPGLLRHHVLLPVARRGGSASVLEVGCGGGDVLVWLARAARAEGISLELCGLDSDARAVAHARHALASYPEARVRHASLDELDLIGESADYVLCNHVLHHLPPQEIVDALRTLRRAARRRLLINDLERSRSAYWLFSALARVAFRRSFVAEDGCLSIRKGFRVPELQAACRQADFPRASRVFRAAPWRVVIVAPADPHLESTMQFPMEAALFGWGHASPTVEVALGRST
jgi:2-polyprenyl-3-methyl-5-hydroxy-6-metoxy-1,4-benzoquinol methylase